MCMEVVRPLFQLICVCSPCKWIPELHDNTSWLFKSVISRLRHFWQRPRDRWERSVTDGKQAVILYSQWCWGQKGVTFHKKTSAPKDPWWEKVPHILLEQLSSVLLILADVESGGLIWKASILKQMPLRLPVMSVFEIRSHVAMGTYCGGASFVWVQWLCRPPVVIFAVFLSLVKIFSELIIAGCYGDIAATAVYWGGFVLFSCYFFGCFSHSWDILFDERPVVERQQSLGNSSTLKSKVNFKVFKCTCVTHAGSRHRKNKLRSTSCDPIPFRDKVKNSPVSFEMCLGS